LHARGEELFARLWNGLTAINGVCCYGPPPERPRTPTVSFTVAGVPSAEVAKALVQDGVFVSNGNFYATGVLKGYGIGPEGLVRAGCACYTTEDEVNRLIEGARRIVAGK
jgi:selenocysteine lyase/cysteine desulfurase